jgi:hypothetical protein
MAPTYPQRINADGDDQTNYIATVSTLFQTYRDLGKLPASTVAGALANPTPASEAHTTRLLEAFCALADDLATRVVELERGDECPKHWQKDLVRAWAAGADLNDQNNGERAKW